MKIVIIASLFRPLSRGGAEVIVESIADELKKNHDVIVITTRTWGGFLSLIPRATHEDRMTVIRYFPLNLFSFATINRRSLLLRIIWHLVDIFSVHTFFVIRSLLKRIKPDCVMTHNLKGIGYTVPMAIRSLNLFHIHTLHDIQLVVPSGLMMYGEESIERSILSTLHAGISRMFFASPALVLSPSQFLADYCRSHRFFLQSKIPVIRNPAPVVRTNESPRSLNDDLIHFIAIGTLNRAKGMSFALRSFLSWDNPRARLTIIGDGCDEERMKLLSRTDKRVRMLGRLSHQQTLEVIRTAHYTIVPSLCYENSPTVILESFACGVPVIAPRIGGGAELLEMANGGFCFEPGSQKELQRCLEQACAHSEYEEMVRRVQLYAIQQSIENYCSLLINEYTNRTVVK